MQRKRNGLVPVGEVFGGLGGSLERLRGDIAEVARKLAVYVRAGLERNRGRSGPDRG